MSKEKVMKSTPLFLTVLAACAPLLISFAAHASTHEDAQSPATVTAASPQDVKLGPMVVTEMRLHTLLLPVKREMLKSALNRPIRLTRKNLSKLECRLIAADLETTCITRCSARPTAIS